MAIESDHPEALVSFDSLFKIQIGSAKSPTALMVGWKADIGPKIIHNMALSPLLAILKDHVFMSLLPTDFATDALNPLDLEFHRSDIAPDGVVITENAMLGPGGVQCIDLTFHLLRPPKFWVIVNGIRRRGTERDLSVDGKFEAINPEYSESIFDGLSSIGEDKCIRLGTWLTYRVSLPGRERESLVRGLLDSKIISKEPPSRITETVSINYSTIALQFRSFPDVDDIKKKWKIKYLIDSLLSLGILINDQVNELCALLLEIKALPKGQDGQSTKSLDASERARLDRETNDKRERMLTYLFKQSRIWDLKPEFEKKKGCLLPGGLTPRFNHLVYIGKVVITPTRVMCRPPELQTSNFVLRLFPKEVEQGRFLRVQFWDESSRLSINYEKEKDDIDSNEGILARFRRCLRYGFKVGGRTYTTLAYSASQVRSGAYWAICENPKTGFTRQAVLDKLGDFDQERIVAKNAARRGQSFSTTRDIDQIIPNPDGKLSVKDYTLIRDYKTENGHYTFSDGVGICTQVIASKASDALRDSNVAPPPYPTSAVQFRMGGCKGIVVAWPPAPMDDSGELEFPEIEWPDMAGFDLMIRPSQTKFHSPSKNFGVVRTSTYSNAFLNREVLILLESRGIRFNDVFAILKTQVAKIIGTESHFVRGERIEPVHKLLFSPSRIKIEELLMAGLYSEPFVQSLIRLCAHHALWLLKWKARIPIEMGTNALGGVDELGVLDEGQVYCRIMDDEGREHTVTGKCIIFRAPTRHPGDVQIVEAVDHPALRAARIFNVILFNRQGDRDLPNKCGGGDLDGDDYTLIWDPIFTKWVSFEEPMNYTPSPDKLPKRVEKVTHEHILDFLPFYLKNDSLGVISNAHMTLCEQLKPKHENCQYLAELHSAAVDFAKTGVPATLDQDLRPTSHPDFMGPRRSGNVYESQGILGRLFRYPDLRTLEVFKEVQNGVMDPRLASIPIKPGMKAAAQKLKIAFDSEMDTLRFKFQATETELMAGLILELPGGLQRIDKSGSLRDPVWSAVNTLQAEFENVLHKLSGKAGKYGLSEAHRFAVACYVVNYEENEKIADVSERKMAFPYVYWKLICEVLNMNI